MPTFLMIKEGGAIDDTSTAKYLILVENCFSELKRLVPTN